MASNPILEGLMQGVQMRQMMNRAQMEEQEFQLRKQQIEQARAVNELNTMMTLARNARPADSAGMVQDQADLPDIGTSVPITRKAGAGGRSVVKWGGQAFELLSEEEQAARARSTRVADARAMIPVQNAAAQGAAVAKVAGEQEARSKFGVVPQGPLASFLSIPEGVALLPDEIIRGAGEMGQFNRAVTVAEMQQRAAADRQTQQQQAEVDKQNRQQQFEATQKEEDRKARQKVADTQAKSRERSAALRGRAQGQSEAQGRFDQREYDSITKKLDDEAAKEQAFHAKKLEAGQDTKLTEAARAMRLKALDLQITESQRRQGELRKEQSKFRSRLEGGSGGGGQAAAAKVVSLSQVQAFAKQKGISVDAAKAQAKAEGYEVQ